MAFALVFNGQVQFSLRLMNFFLLVFPGFLKQLSLEQNQCYIDEGYLKIRWYPVWKYEVFSEFSNILR
jgi:hypothetical protein